MQVQEENPLEKNDLAEALKKFRDKFKSGELLNIRFVALAAVLLAILGVWWYLRSNPRSEAGFWDQFNTLNAAKDFETFAKDRGASGVSQLARLQQARFLLSLDGIPQLTSIDPEKRKKAIASIEEARELFTKLSEEFRNDVTLKGQCLDGLARAELALVGIAKTPGGSDHRGEVAKAAAIYKQYAELVGPKTTVGEQLLKKAAELEDERKATELKQLGMALDLKYSPRPIVEEPKLPTGLSVPEKSGLTDPIAPKIDLPKTDSPMPKAPEKAPEVPKGAVTIPAPSIPPPPMADPPKSK